MRLSIPRADPSAWATAYAVVISLSVVTVSLLDGTLYSQNIVHSGKYSVPRYPYLYNISTILDFAILNPVAIFFLLKTRQGFARSFKHFKKRGSISLFDQFGFALVSVVLGISAMWFYFKGFVGGTFFTESFAAGPNGTAVISATGWAIFVSTSIFISLSVLVMLEFGHYVLYVRRLEVDDFRFSLPPSIGEDFKVAIAPSVYAAYVLVTLFVTIAVFVFRDFYQFNIHQSRRVWLFAPYIAACMVTFLPIWHLHKIMSAQKQSIIDRNNNVIERDIMDDDSDPPRRAAKIDPLRLTQLVDKIEKLQTFYAAIPVWPATFGAMIAPNISFFVSTITLLYKIGDTLRLATLR